MNTVIENILSRRSIRKFNDEPVTKEELLILGECAVHAPSAMCRDTWKFVIINNEELIRELITIMQSLLNKPAYNMYNPKAVIIGANRKDNSRGVEDNACALENIFLAAHSMNIGTVWINQVRDLMDDEVLRAYLNKIGIDEEMNVYGVVSLGHYDEKPVDKPRNGIYTYIE